MRIFTILFIVFWMASTQYAIAQGQIRGRVRDYGMNESVVGGTIYVLPQDVDKKNQNQKITAISQEDGDFVIENVPAGVYDLECYAPGFVTQRIVGFQVKNDQTKLAYFRMKVGSASKQGIDIVHTYASLQAKQKSEITTASQTEESLFDAPATVYLVSEKEIEERGYNSIIDLLQDIPEIQHIDQKTKERMRLLEDTVAKTAKLRMLIQNPEARSSTVLAITGREEMISEVKKSAEKEGMQMGGGYGPLKASSFRIANFPAISDQEFENLIGFLKKY